MQALRLHPRSEVYYTRVVTAHGPQRSSKQRQCCCFVYLEDGPAEATQHTHRQSVNGNGGGNYRQEGDNLRLKPSLTDSQLQEAITKVVGTDRFNSGSAVFPENSAKNFVQDEKEQQSELSNIWEYEDEGNGADLLEADDSDVGRADVRALQAMQTRLSTSKEAESSASGTHSVSTPVASHAGSCQAQEPLPMLPELEHPAHCNSHRMSNDASQFMDPIHSSSKFLDRFMIFSEQLRQWGYIDTRYGSSKRVLATFARSNADLLYMLPVRELHIFVKKFKVFSARSMDRKYRAAAARLCNIYVDFQLRPTFNGNATFQDLTRLILFVATSEFGVIENKAPGIVAAASDLLPEILIAATQPPSDKAHDDHSSQWRDLCDEQVKATTPKASMVHNKKRFHKKRRGADVHDREDDEVERRLESLEEKLAASLRTSSGSSASRPWTPWDHVGKRSSSKQIPRQKKQHASSKSSTEDGRQHSSNKEQDHEENAGENGSWQHADDQNRGRTASIKGGNPMRKDFMQLISSTDGGSSPDGSEGSQLPRGRNGGGYGGFGGGLL